MARHENVYAIGFTQPETKNEKPVGITVESWAGHFCEDDDDPLGKTLYPDEDI